MRTDEGEYINNDPLTLTLSPRRGDCDIKVKK
jgi:hypothetical protein